MRELLLFAVAVVIHECGHVITAGILGIKLISFRLRGIGAVMQYDFSRAGYFSEAAVHLSGAVANLLFAFLAAMMYKSSANYFIGISATLAFVNLLPIKGFDGGGAMYCVLSRFLMPSVACRMCSILSVMSIAVLWTAVLWIEMRCGGNLGLIIFVLLVMVGQIMYKTGA